MKNTKTSAKHSKPKEKRPLFGQRRRAEGLPGAQPQAQPAPQAQPDGPKAKKDASRHDAPRRGGWKWVLLTIVLLIALAAGWTAYAWKAKAWPFSEQLQTSFFHLYSEKVNTAQTIRLVVLSDLHNSEFGAYNSELVDKVRRLSPDVILIAGDMVNKNDPNTDVAVTLCAQLQQIAPVYYGIGNHEGNMIYTSGIRIDDLLREQGVTVLINESVDTTVKGMEMSIGSVSTSVLDYDQYSAPFVEAFEQKTDFKLLIAHCPDLFYEKMADVNVDLAVAGHFHGGQVQVPLLGGLYAIGQGFFPKYCNGMFTLTNGHLFVTRGLGNSHEFPRINNRPEIAVIDVNSRKDGTTRGR